MTGRLSRLLLSPLLFLLWLPLLALLAPLLSPLARVLRRTIIDRGKNVRTNHATCSGSKESDISGYKVDPAQRKQTGLVYQLLFHSFVAYGVVIYFLRSQTQDSTK